jgi:hypothetical protein
MRASIHTCDMFKDCSSTLQEADLMKAHMRLLKHQAGINDSMPMQSQVTEQAHAVTNG